MTVKREAVAHLLLWVLLLRSAWGRQAALGGGRAQRLAEPRAVAPLRCGVQANSHRDVSGFLPCLRLAPAAQTFKPEPPVPSDPRWGGGGIHLAPFVPGLSLLDPIKPWFLGSLALPSSCFHHDSGVRRRPEDADLPWRHPEVLGRRLRTEQGTFPAAPPASLALTCSPVRLLLHLMSP